MRSTFRWAAYAAIVVASAGCGSGIDVRTMAAPDAGLGAFHSFRMLAGPARRDGRPATGSDDPMISNSIANRVIRERIVRSFQDRGYTLDERNADFGVAFYASTREKLDVDTWDYGYPVRLGWPINPAVQGVSQYTEGSVVVDVVRLGSRQLLWRGEGRAALSDDPSDNVTQLAKAAAAIIDKFPHATTHVVAAR